MPNYQTYIQQAQSLLIGNFLMKIAPSAGTMVNDGINIGIGQVTGVTEDVDTIHVQGNNSIDPEKKVTEQRLNITFELLETFLPNFAAIRGKELDVVSSLPAGTYSGGYVQTFSTGGLTEVKDVALMLHNVKIEGGATVETVFIGYKGTIKNGLEFTPKSDNDEDPVSIWSFDLEFLCDTARAAGDQLFKIETEPTRYGKWADDATGGIWTSDTDTTTLSKWI